MDITKNPNKETKYKIINAVITSLNLVQVSGYDNLNYILGSIQYLQKLLEILQNEDGYNDGLIDSYRKELIELRKGVDNDTTEDADGIN